MNVLGSGHDQPRAGAAETEAVAGAAVDVPGENGFAASATGGDAAKPAAAPTVQAAADAEAARLRWRIKYVLCIRSQQSTSPLVLFCRDEERRDPSTSSTFL